ncbi:UDP-N-acetylmuramoyl-tripeptide--D-alanyl-D-alanine ligase [Patulibacter americanus]|uniref:UDP-N-acetylmuramoyl-tripeptide--D-alanyl-D- alanine ligase n=1 Tax=Patulibacter americanus TaxID=588672 RepID=UPI0003B52D93|nr:UDP-N-acetylmuramoyl-tripeptide--D-alanyl-D-alanine ligase [Patulibacter americanus]
MHSRDAAWIAAAAGAELVLQSPPAGAPADPQAPGPSSVVIDSRGDWRTAPGDARPLFVGIPGARVDGGSFAAEVLLAGAWGVLVRPEHAAAAVEAGYGTVLTHPDPTVALGALARGWRRELGATVVGITGSVGKTSTKDLLAGILATQLRVVATEANLNTEIGLPLTVLGAPEGTQVLVLEMAMRGRGQIAELAAIAEPDVGVITNIAPVHVELLGSLQAIADTKAELLAGIVPGGTAIIPRDEPLLAAHRPHGVTVVEVGPDDPAPAGLRIAEDVSPTVLRNLPAAVAAARAVGVEPDGPVDPRISAMRGQRLHLARDVVVVVDCYNANPMSMTAALDDLATSAPGRKVAVLGDMLELGPDELRFHAELGAHARSAGVEELVAVGPLSRHTGTGFGRGVHWVPDAAAAAKLVPTLLEPGDTVLLKASRGIGLERVADALQGEGA